jgi:hypothetical protein
MSSKMLHCKMRPHAPMPMPPIAPVTIARVGDEKNAAGRYYLRLRSIKENYFLTASLGDASG